MAAVWNTNTNQKRLARIAYNENGWQKPSGEYGKSKDLSSYEMEYGFGHEEWLFDKEKLIDDYHYAFLEPMRKNHDLYNGEKFDVALYTVDADTSRRYRVGDIADMEVIDEQEARRVFKYYEKQGWLKQMRKDVLDVGGTVNFDIFAIEKSLELFNIRFHPQKARLEPSEVPADNPLHKINRYTLLYDKAEYAVEEGGDDDTFDFASAPSSLPPENAPTHASTQYERAPKVVELTFLHCEISDKLHCHFAGQYGKGMVKTNVRAGYGGCRVDMIVDRNPGLVYYEIKTYDSLRLSIREALGQILEYAMWPDKNKAAKFVIVTQPCPRDEPKVRQYLENLRRLSKLNIYYQSFDPSTGVLSDEM